MTCITKQHVGKYTYLYESTSFRDARGKPRNKKTKIGKIDPESGTTVYTVDYLQRNRNCNVTQAVSQTSAVSIKELLDGVRDFGVYWFLSQLSSSIGLTTVLQETFPHIWKELFTIACYLVVSDKPVMTAKIGFPRMIGWTWARCRLKG